VAQELLDIAEELYGLPLAEFTAARDARVRELKGTPVAGEVKALRKPATAAWVVDLLVRREHEQVLQMIAVGEALRRAQEGMDASALRELTKQRRQLTAALTVRARALARSVGLRVTEQVAEQVEETLTAAMIDAVAAQAVRSGLLVTPLRATGVGDVDAAAAVAVPDALGFTVAPVADPPVSLRVVPDPEPDRRALEEARSALAEATEELSSAEAGRAEAVAEVERLQARSLQVQAELDELRRRLAELETAAQEVDDQLAEAEDERAEAEDAVRVAVRRRDEAAARLERVRESG
jgi:hypothetical protein